MLSKQEKMKYGELLRQQIKEREQAKKAQRREHTPAIDTNILPQPHPRPINHSPPPEINLDRFKSDREAQKELLAKKMEQGAYNPFGKIGSGAPNKANDQRRPPPTIEPQQQIDEKLQGVPIAPPPPLYQPVQGYRRIPTPQFLQGAYGNTPFVGEQYASPAPYGYVNVIQNDINYVGKLNLSPRQPVGFEPRYEHLQLNPVYPPPPQAYQPQPPPPPPVHEQERAHEIQSKREEQLQVFRKGGRNLLKFQNEVPEQIISKQNEKLRLQQQLKKQMEQAARRKKEEEQRIRQQDERLERKNKEFLQMQKRKYEQQMNAKKGQAKTVEEANTPAKKEPNNLKKEKFQKIREEVARRQQEERRQAQLRQQQEKQKQNAVQKYGKNLQTPRQNQMDEVQSAISGETQMSRGFNTAISKEFFKKQREKSSHDRNKADKLTSEMEKMRKEIAHQGHYYHRQIEKVHKEAERAKMEKERADEEIHRLKLQLREKMDYNNKKFLEGIYHGKVQVKDPYYADQVTLEQPQAHNTLKPKKAEKLVLQEYRPEDHREYAAQDEGEIMRNDSEMMSLIGDSKKIPLELDANESLSISKLDHFAKDTNYFKAKLPPPPPTSNKYRPQESIMEEQERREESRQASRNAGRRGGSARGEQQLQRLIESRKKSRGGWGELSSVNQEMVNEIDNMMKQRERPRSHLANAGEKSLQSYERMPPKNELKKRTTSMSQDSQGTINSLDRLIQKYM